MKPKHFADAMAMATVLSWRLPMLWAMGFDPTAKRRAEALRMVTEKNAALMEGLAAGMAEASLAGLKVMSGQNPMAGVAESAMRPALRRMRANARRLTRKGRI